MSARICPICKRQALDDVYRPFCSKRCAEVDLQRWFAGAYAVPAEEPQDGALDPPGQSAGRPEDDLL